MKKNKLMFLLPLVLIFLGWGAVGHRIINRNSTQTFPPELNFLMFWADSLAAHGSDADIRKDWDPNEDVKHYIDIDNYPEFVANGFISQDFDSVVIQHGYSFVIDQGILPWSILATVDSLESAFQEGSWQKAMLLAADLGHYIGDGHMPLHITRNYNGQYSGQTGVHSRYESSMINTYQSQIIYYGDSVRFIENIPDFVFEMIYTNYEYVDSVLQADLTAKSFAGGSYNSAYYQKLWELTKGFTIRLFKNASYDLACLIFTAWKNAGEPVITNIQNEISIVNDFKLEQNYPNPFNPTTKISWQSSVSSRQVLKLFDVTGKEVATLVDEYIPAGNYETQLDASHLSSGVYFYQLKVNEIIQTRKMLLLR